MDIGLTLGRRPAKPKIEFELPTVNSAEELDYNRKFSKKLLGLDLEEAEIRASKIGLLYRTIERDGRTLGEDGTLDVRRLNFIVRQGKVIDVSVG